MKDLIHGNPNNMIFRKKKLKQTGKINQSRTAKKQNMTFGTKMSGKGSVKGGYQGRGGQGRGRAKIGYSYSGDNPK